MAAMGSNGERLDGLCENDRRNANIFIKWTLAWAVSLVTAALFLGPSESGMADITLIHYALALVPLVVTCFMVKSFLHFIRYADEMLRLLLLQAASRGFGVVFILGVAFMLWGQLFGDWEDAGTVMWVSGFLTFEISFIRHWKQFNAE